MCHVLGWFEAAVVHVKEGMNDNPIEIELFYHSPSFIHLNDLSSSPKTHLSSEYSCANPMMMLLA